MTERAEAKGYGRKTVDGMCSKAPKWWVKQVQENRSLMGLSPLQVEGVADEECSKEQRAINKIERSRYEIKALEAAKRLKYSIDVVDEAVARRFD